MSAHNIVIEPYKPTEWSRGEKRIIVDGEPWGYIHMKSYGVHGVSYWFEQIRARGAICENDKPVEVRVAHKRYATAQQLPIAEQLLGAAEYLVDSGLLKHPKVIEKAQADAAERYRKNREIQEAKRKADDLALANSLIAWHAPALCGVDDLQSQRAALAQALAEQFEKIRS